MNDGFSPQAVSAAPQWLVIRLTVLQRVPPELPIGCTPWVVTAGDPVPAGPVSTAGAPAGDGAMSEVDT